VDKAIAPPTLVLLPTTEDEYEEKDELVNEISPFTTEKEIAPPFPVLELTDEYESTFELVSEILPLEVER
jgi:hypothetical protein